MSKSKELFMKMREEESQKYAQVEFEYHYNLWADKGDGSFGDEDFEDGVDTDHQHRKPTNTVVDDSNEY